MRGLQVTCPTLAGVSAQMDTGEAHLYDEAHYVAYAASLICGATGLLFAILMFAVLGYWHHVGFGQPSWPGPAWLEFFAGGYMNGGPGLLCGPFTVAVSLCGAVIAAVVLRSADARRHRGAWIAKLGAAFGVCGVLLMALLGAWLLGDASWWSL
jgi:hypothetical protein